MVLVENVLNLEHISYTKLKKVRYYSHDEGKRMEQHITEDIMVTAELDRFAWNKITKCENFKGFYAKDGSIVIKIKDTIYKVV